MTISKNDPIVAFALKNNMNITFKKGTSSNTIEIWVFFIKPPRFSCNW